MNAQTVKEPTGATLRKYGLDLSMWRKILFDQGGVCAICRSVPPSGRLHIEHEHVKGFKAMPPEEKRKHVRGLVCSYDNRFKIAKLTLDSAEQVVQYLARYEQTKAR